MAQTVLRAEFQPGEKIYAARRKVKERFHISAAGVNIDQTPENELAEPRVTGIEADGGQRADRLFLILKGRVIRNVEVVADRSTLQI